MTIYGISKYILGACLILVPFVGITYLMIKESGLKIALGVWLLTLAIIGCIGAGVILLLS